MQNTWLDIVSLHLAITVVFCGQLTKRVSNYGSTDGSSKHKVVFSADLSVVQSVAFDVASNVSRSLQLQQLLQRLIMFHLQSKTFTVRICDNSCKNFEITWESPQCRSDQQRQPMVTSFMNGFHDTRFHWRFTAVKGRRHKEQRNRKKEKQKTNYDNVRPKSACTYVHFYVPCTKGQTFHVLLLMMNSARTGEEPSSEHSQ